MSVAVIVHSDGSSDESTWSCGSIVKPKLVGASGKPVNGVVPSGPVIVHVPPIDVPVTSTRIEPSGSSNPMPLVIVKTSGSVVNVAVIPGGGWNGPTVVGWF